MAIRCEDSGRTRKGVSGSRRPPELRRSNRRLRGNAIGGGGFTRSLPSRLALPAFNRLLHLVQEHHFSSRIAFRERRAVQLPEVCEVRLHRGSLPGSAAPSVTVARKTEEVCFFHVSRRCEAATLSIQQSAHCVFALVQRSERDFAGEIITRG